MESKQVRVINAFNLTSQKNANHHDLENVKYALNQKAHEMEVLVEAYNFEDHPVCLHIFGDLKSDLKFRVECGDAKTTKRLTEVLKQYLLRQA